MPPPSTRSAGCRAQRQSAPNVGWRVNIAVADGTRETRQCKDGRRGADATTLRAASPAGPPPLPGPRRRSGRTAPASRDPAAAPPSSRDVGRVPGRARRLGGIRPVRIRDGAGHAVRRRHRPGRAGVVQRAPLPGGGRRRDGDAVLIGPGPAQSRPRSRPPFGLAPRAPRPGRANPGRRRELVGGALVLPGAPPGPSVRSRRSPPEAHGSVTGAVALPIPTEGGWRGSWW